MLNTSRTCFGHFDDAMAMAGNDSYLWNVSFFDSIIYKFGLGQTAIQLPYGLHG